MWTKTISKDSARKKLYAINKVNNKNERSPFAFSPTLIFHNKSQFMIWWWVYRKKNMPYMYEEQGFSRWKVTNFFVHITYGIQTKSNIMMVYILNTWTCHAEIPCKCYHQMTFPLEITYEIAVKIHLRCVSNFKSVCLYNIIMKN